MAGVGEAAAEGDFADGEAAGAEEGLGAVEAAHGIVFADYFAPELAALAPLAADGLVDVTPRSIHVTARGRLLVRTVAMQFDRHLREAREKTRYSKVI